MNPIPPSLRSRRSVAEFLLPLCTALVGGLYYFRSVWATGFDRLIGDVGDGLLIAALTEHWHRVFLGLESWRDPNWFYPVTGTLGYSDAFFGYGVVHTAIRFLGLDPLSAMQVALILFYLAGFAGAYFLLRRFAGLPALWASLGALLYSSGHWLYLAGAHSHLQLLSAWFLPWMLILFERWRCSIQWHEPARWAWGPALVVAFGVLYYTAFYIAWFLTLFLAVACAFWIIRLTRSVKNPIAAGVQWVKRELPHLATLLAVAIVVLTPFIVTYLPALHESRGHPYSVTHGKLPQIRDFINVGPDNLVWGFLNRVVPFQRPEWYHELYYGYPLGLLILFLSGYAVSWVRRRDRSESGRPVHIAGLFEPQSVLWLGGSVLLCWLLMVKIFDFSLWRVIYELLPGGTAMRVVPRMQIILALPVIAVALHALRHALLSVSNRNRGLAQVLAIGAAGWLMVEQINGQENARIRVSEFNNLVRSVDSPPGDLDAFYVASEGMHNDSSWYVQVAAMHIAQHWDLKTLNGYSGLLPSGWNLFDIQDLAYPQHVQDWRRKHDLNAGIYALNLTDGTWHLAPSLDAKLPAFEVLARLTPADPPGAIEWIEGWSEPEGWGVWTDGDRASLQIDARHVPAGATMGELVAHAFTHEKHPRQSFHIYWNQRFVGRWIFNHGDGRKRFSFPLHDWSEEDCCSITIEIADPASPHDLDGTRDPRRLGLGLKEIRFYGPPVK